MKTAYNLKPQTEWRLNDTKIAFSGPPYQCVGTVHVENFSPQKLKVRYLPVTIDDGAPENQQLPSTAVHDERLYCECQGRLLGKTKAPLSVRLNLPSNTPAGQYSMQIQVGDQSVAASVEVLENDVLKIQPRRIVLEGCPGDTVIKTINFHNQGNTTIVLPSRSMVWFEERNWIGFNLVQTIRETTTGDDYEAYLNTLLKRLQKTMLPAMTVDFDVNADNKNGNDNTCGSTDLLLSPNQMLSRRFAVTLPKGLQKGKTYHGFVKIQRFRFWLALYCNGS